MKKEEPEPCPEWTHESCASIPLLAALAQNAAIVFMCYAVIWILDPFASNPFYVTIGWSMGCIIPLIIWIYWSYRSPTDQEFIQFFFGIPAPRRVDPPWMAEACPKLFGLFQKILAIMAGSGAIIGVLAS